MAALSPILWDGSPRDLRGYSMLHLTVTTPPSTAAVVQFCPHPDPDDDDWIDHETLGSVQARGRMNAQAMSWVRIKPGTGDGGTFYLGAGS